jgi:hypothetical protein
MKRITIKTDIDIDTKFWALLPAININLNSVGIEFEWLCLRIYIDKIKPETPPKKVMNMDCETHVAVDAGPALKTIRKIKRKIFGLKVKMYFKKKCFPEL